MKNSQFQKFHSPNFKFSVKGFIGKEFNKSNSKLQLQKPRAWSNYSKFVIVYK